MIKYKDQMLRTSAHLYRRTNSLQVFLEDEDKEPYDIITVEVDDSDMVDILESKPEENKFAAYLFPGLDYAEELLVKYELAKPLREIKSWDSYTTVRAWLFDLNKFDDAELFVSRKGNLNEYRQQHEQRGII